MSEPDEKTITIVAVAISGAPFPSIGSERKARAAIAAYQRALAEAGMVIVPNGVAKALQEAEEASAQFKAEIAETRDRIRRGARGPAKTFKL